MNIKLLVRKLLHEEESSSLDFKREQYRFDKASDLDKSELLKDILAFANSWRRIDAYILVGVEEKQGFESTIIGISSHIDDAKIQQFVNAKTNRPIEFSYLACEIENSQIALIHIPVQNRPFYLSKDYGKLKKQIVYVRRGSSTDTASPDEIASMGQEMDANELVPNLSCYMVLGEHDDVFETQTNISTIDIEIPEEIEFPEYGIAEHAGFRIPMFDPNSNRDYYFDQAKYIKAISRVRGLKIGIDNNGNAVAKDVKVELSIDDPSKSVLILKICDLPKKPSTDSFSITDLHNNFISPHDITIKERSSGWLITCNLGKVQAGDISVSNDLLLLGSDVTKTIKLESKIFSDDLSAPIISSLSINISVTHKDMIVEDFLGSE